jgi:hypothetical protein
MVPQLPQGGAENDRIGQVLDVGKLFGRWDIAWDRCYVEVSPLQAQNHIPAKKSEDLVARKGGQGRPGRVFRSKLAP